MDVALMCQIGREYSEKFGPVGLLEIQMQGPIGNGSRNSSFTESLHVYDRQYSIAEKHVAINCIMGNVKMHVQDGNHQKLRKVGALLVHGLSGSLSDMEELTGFLASYNIVTLNVLFPGRGTHVHDMLPIDWSGWSNVVVKELQRLKQWCEYVFLIGHSLGGTMCLRVAASEPVAGIVTMCTPVYIYRWMFPDARMTKHSTPVPPILREDVRSYEARRRYQSNVYSKNPVAPVEGRLHFLPALRTELPSITAPALIMTAIHDHVVPASDGQTLYRLIGSQEKYLVKFRQSYHLLMKDREREEVFARILHFIQNHAQ